MLRKHCRIGIAQPWQGVRASRLEVGDDAHLTQTIEPAEAEKSLLRLIRPAIKTAMTQASLKPVRLTSLSHGGGCGCKIAPGALAQILKGSSGFTMAKELMVGIETAHDAAVWRLNDDQALIATTDFFMPTVDDPHDFGRIAATNAISDVYATGGR